jgi:hypothetical protein
MNNHKNETPIAEYLALWEKCPEESKEKRQKIIADLTLKGNKIYNDECFQASNVTTTSLLPVKRPPLKNANKNHEYVSCLLCHGLFVKKHFYQHASICSKKKTDQEEPGIENVECEEENDIFNKKRTCYLKEFGLNMLHSNVNAAKKFKEEILPSLRMDDIGKQAIKDPLLLSVVTDFFNSHQCLKDKHQVTKKLRDGAKLLLKVREIDSTIVELKDIFRPNKVDSVITACHVLCNIQDMDDAFQNPSNVTVGMNGRLSWILEECGKKLTDQIYCDDASTDDEKGTSRRKVKVFMEILRRRWKYFISTNLENIRRRGKMLKPFILPVDDDIKKLASMLRQMEEDLQYKLSCRITEHDYEMLCKVTIGHILTLNRRRPFEATNSEIEFFLKRKSNSDYYPSDELETLAEEERVSLEELSSYVVPAKGTEAVATILLTKSMEKSIEMIVKCREHFNMSKSIYLFPRPGLSTLFDGSKVMRELVSLCPNLEKPEFLTANGLRHNVATKGHIKGPQFTHKLSKFMCHTQQVHDKNYVAQVSMVNKGVIGNYLANLEGTTLNSQETENEDAVDEPENHVPHTVQSETYESLNDHRQDPTYEPSSEDENDNYNFENHTISARKKVSKQRRKWTYEEKKLVSDHFKEFLRKKQSPGTKQCRMFLEKHRQQLSGRTTIQVYTFIHNIISNKVTLPNELQ